MAIIIGTKRDGCGQCEHECFALSSNNGDYWKVTYPKLSINDIVKIKVNSDKRTCFVSLFRNKTLPLHINITIKHSLYE